MTKPNARRLLFAILIIALALGSARAEDWPMYRYDRMRKSVSPEKLKLPLQQAWKFRSRLPRGLAIVAGGDGVFFTGDDGRLGCLAAKTGKLRWELLTDGAIRYAPSYADGKVYAGSDDGFAYCADAKTGKLVWKYRGANANRWFISFGQMSSIWPVRTDVLVDDGVAYFGAGIFPHDGMYVNAVDAKSGRRVWQSMCSNYGLEGYFFATKRTMILPTGFKGFHKWQVKFNRSDGSYAYDHDPEFDFWKGFHLMGGQGTVTAGGIQYVPAGKGVKARDPKTGKDLWSGKMGEDPHHIVVANGRLFVSTRQGSIYGFARKGTRKHGIVKEKVGLRGRSGNRGAFANAAKAIIAASGVKAGFALVLDCDSGKLAYELAKQGNFQQVCAVFDDPAKARRARKAFARANLNCFKISVMYRKRGTRLPYSPNFADVIVSERCATGGKLPRYTAAVERLLKPIRGVALFGGKHTRDTLKRWTKTTGVKGWKAVAQNGTWAKHVRPPIKNGGGWTHPYGSAGNTMSSHDSALKGPLGVVWYGRPWVHNNLAVRHKPEPVVVPRVLNGVMVTPVANDRLDGYDQYNGRFLWQLQKGGIGRRTDRMAAGGDSFYIAEGKNCERYDVWTGKLVRKYDVPLPGATWGLVAVSEDGKTIWGTGNGGNDWRCIFALNTETGKARWVLGGPKTGHRFNWWHAISDGRIYLVGGAAKDPLRKKAMDEMRAYLKKSAPQRLKAFEGGYHDMRHLTVIDAMKGNILYECAIDTKDNNEWFAARSGKFVCTMRTGEKGWNRWGGFKRYSIAVYDGATGKIVWKKPCHYRFRPVINDDTIFAEPWTYDLHTGERKQRVNPITGENGDWATVRYDKQCGGYNGSSNFIFGRSKGLGYHDLQRDNGMYVFWHSRQACSPDVSSGGGMMVKAPLNRGCGCPWSQPFAFGMAQVSQEPAVPFQQFMAGRSLPVKKLRINLGAVGDRRDKNGNLWLHPERRMSHVGLHLKFESTMAFYPGGNSRDRDPGIQKISASGVKSNEAPVLFESAAFGLKRYFVAVTSPTDGAGTFTVRLGFAAMPHDKPGQRVFDVRLNGETVLKDFDIMKEAGNAKRAVWKEFKVTLERDLALDLVARSETPSPDETPVISALVVTRTEMTTLGLGVPLEPWLNKAKPEKETTIKLANFRDKPFKGKLVVDAPKGVAISLPADGKVELKSEQRTEVRCLIVCDALPKPKSHSVNVKLVSSDGKIAAQRVMTIDWLGTLERRIVGLGARHQSDPKGNRAVGKQTRPTAYAPLIASSKGAKRAGDEGTSYAYLSFEAPREAGKIHRARVRLYVSTGLWRVRQVVFAPAGKTGQPPKNYWGSLRRLPGPPWQADLWEKQHQRLNFDKLKYPNRPRLRAESFPLAPVAHDPDMMECEVPTDIPADDKGRRRAYFAIKPTALNGPVYHSNQGWNVDRVRAPSMVVDYEPKKN